MKRAALYVAAGFAALLAASAFAGEAEHKERMFSKLAHDSSSANVKAVALRQKEKYCERNAKNKSLHGSDKEAYINTCMNRDEAREQLALVNGKTTRIAANDINKTLRESPAAAGHK
ncbi:MAG: hypothetical protein HZC43_04900 [Nitrosomonadales bacterium]|nr:hypothetical protein [Nitrosomonadales bacterium]